ncbi:MAG: glycosyltransferase family 2 protein [Actinobacteria bacterium]|nr:glycosyltransferase family 2 protein [Actinomycetota bacterium]MCG2796042.1 glycosyltransferase family 2 protein [Actinomycetes bacterium]
MEEASEAGKGSVKVVIVNYNGKRYLGECLASLRLQDFRDFSVLVFDNGSSDGSADLMEREFPEMELVRSPVNLGFAAGNNRAIERVIGREKVDFIFTLNNDVILDRSCLGRLHEAMSREGPEVWSCQPKIFLLKNGKTSGILNNAGLEIWRDGRTFDRGLNQVDRGQFDNETDIFGTCAGASLYRVSVLEKVGLFDEDFFAYSEDVDIAWRGRRAGYRSVLCPGAVCYHHHGGSDIGLAWKKTLISRNHIWVLLKNYPRFYVILSPVFTLLRWLCLAFVLVTRTGRKDYSTGVSPGGIRRREVLGAVLRGYWLGLKGIRACLRKRKQTMSLTVLSEHEVSRLVRGYSVPLRNTVSNRGRLRP